MKRKDIDMDNVVLHGKSIQQIDTNTVSMSMGGMSLAMHDYDAFNVESKIENGNSESEEHLNNIIDGDIESGKCHKKDKSRHTKSCIWHETQWMILLSTICLLIALCSICGFLWILSKEPPPEIGRTTLQWRFPEGDFDSCCSTPEDIEKFLSICNQTFQSDGIECGDTERGSANTKRGSVKIDFQSVAPMERSIFERHIEAALTSQKYIHNFSTVGHHKAENCPQLQAISDKCESELKSTTYIFKEKESFFF